VQVFSAENTTAIRGKGFDGVVVDEAAHMPGEVWSLVLRPALSERQGWATFFSTPKGFNWFFEGFEAAGEGSGSSRWQRPTSENKMVPEEEIALARRQMRDAEFRQEYLAEFTALGNMRFEPGVLDVHAARCRPPLGAEALPEAIRGVPGVQVWQLPQPGVQYVMYTDTSEGLPGQDPASTVLLDPRTLTHVASVHGTFEPGALAAYSARMGAFYNYAMWGVERNNHGHAVILAAREVLRYTRLWYTEDRPPTMRQELDGNRPPERAGFLVTNLTKHAIIDQMVQEVESYRLTSWDKDFWLECRWLEVKPGGKVAAVDGAHDDRVMSMAGAIRMARIPGITNRREILPQDLTTLVVSSSSTGSGSGWKW